MNVYCRLILNKQISHIETISEDYSLDELQVFGARVHNLKNIDVKIPRNKLVVITGISGSGKSSLTFDVIYAEGQRRYMESFSAYARQFLGTFERPDADLITGLSPVISIEQKTTNKNPRSTVGTVTEIYDFLRLLYARTAEAFSYVTGKKMTSYSEDQIIDHVVESFSGKKIYILAPVVRGRKGHYRELFQQIRKQGYLRARVDGDVVEIREKTQVDRYKIHDIEVVVDHLKVKEGDPRLRQSIQAALKMGKDLIMILPEDNKEPIMLSKALMCLDSGISYDIPSPNAFSFNSPYGACPHCKGLGVIRTVNENLLITDENKSINEGAIAPIGQFRDNYMFRELRGLAKKYKISLSSPVKDLPNKVLNYILYGDENGKVEVEVEYGKGETNWYSLEYGGIVKMLERSFSGTQSDSVRKWAESFMQVVTCTECGGSRLKKESLHFKIANANIAQLAQMDINDLIDWFNEIADKLTERQKTIGIEVIKEIRTRLGFLQNVGLTYVTLNRPTRTLSGGESQRIRLASQIGSELVGITYILDEPSIGLHQRDNQRLIMALKQLRDLGNCVLVVEHDKEIMIESDYVIDLGPRAGLNGGYVVAEGSPKQFAKKRSLTAQYLSGKKKIPYQKKRRKGSGEIVELKGATGNNLKKVDVKIPLGKLTCVTGVSGSGKSSLINYTLYPILSKHIYRSTKKILPYKSIKGLEHIDKVIDVDQSPIGRTPRSNPATYIGVFSEIRNLFAKLPESQIRGYKPGRFSFNVKGGRCETCQGGGMKTIEMNFLPDVYVECETCMGKRYNRETLEVRYKGKSIYDVLEMSMDDALEFFEHIPNIKRKLVTVGEVGLGYIKLGQPSTTISGGEAQRVKLATELSKKDTGKTFYILDEPTTGLHFEDIRVLNEVLQKLVDKGNTVLVIEHNLDVIKIADHIIDLGPDGGQAGGTIVAEGTPEQIVKNKKSVTGKYLKSELIS